MIKCVVFDFDGVLIDSNTIKQNAYFEIFGSLEKSREIISSCLMEEREGDRYNVINRILTRLREAGGEFGQETPRADIEQYALAYNQICENLTVTCQEIPGVSNCLDRLVGKFGLYINSATPEEPLKRVIKKRGWGKYFRDILGSPHTKVQNLRIISQQENIGYKEMVFVGDSLRDLSAARVCRCSFIGVRNPDNDFDHQNLLMVDDFYSVEDILCKRSSELNPC